MIKEWSTRSVKLIKETKLINGARWKRANHGFFSKISGQDLKWRPTTQRTYRQSWYYLALASYSFVITINPPFFTVHVTHSWRRLINQILVYYETVNTCRALAVSSRLCTYLYIFLTHSCLKCLFYLFIYSQVNYKASSSPVCLDIVTLPSDLNQELSPVLIPPLFLSLFRLQNRLSSATFLVQKLKPLQLLIISFFFP